MTGGPNNWAAQVTYPPTQAPNTYVFYNYKDTVNVEWVSWAANSSVTNMRIWYWAPNFPDKSPWQAFDQQVVVSQNGTRAYQLSNSKVDDLKKAGVSYFLGQWNLNFTRADMNPAKGLTLSQAFNCSIDDSKPAQVYGKAASGSSSTPDSSSITAASSTPSVTFGGFVASPSASSSTTIPPSVAAGSTTSSASSSPVASAVASGGLSGGAVAGVVIGVLAAVSLFAAAGFFLWRRSRMNAANSAAVNGAGQGFPGYGYPQAPPPGYSASAYAGPGPAVYAGAAKQPMPSEYYNKAQPPVPQMAQSQMYSELPSHSYSRAPATEMPASQPIRQELPG